MSFSVRKSNSEKSEGEKSLKMSVSEDPIRLWHYQLVWC